MNVKQVVRQGGLLTFAACVFEIRLKGCRRHWPPLALWRILPTSVYGSPNEGFKAVCPCLLPLRITAVPPWGKKRPCRLWITFPSYS